jgi:hypothetical protein
MLNEYLLFEYSSTALVHAGNDGPGSDGSGNDSPESYGPDGPRTGLYHGF